MKSGALLLGVMIAITILSPLSLGQQNPSLQGTWSITMSSADVTWDGKKQSLSAQVTGYVYQDAFISPTQPNLMMRIEGELGMRGFIQGTTFVLYRNNDAHCEGPEQNLGREVIVGRAMGKGQVFEGTGTGFDSNPECGGAWVYSVTGKKISDYVPAP
jgi:hypothetical protein